MSLYDDASLIVYPSGYKASKIYAQKPVNGTGDLTFTRASTATRVNESGPIESVATNVPRIDYTGGGCGSLLLEPQRTNVAEYSNDFSSWGAYGTPTITSGQSFPFAAEDSTLVEFATSSSFIRLLGVNVSSGTHTISFWAKKSVSSSCLINADGKTGTFNFDTGVFASGTATGNMVALTDGWFKCTMTFLGVSATAQIRIQGVAYPFGAYFSGFQIEAGSYPTSYIPTSGTTVTRVQDTSITTGLSSVIGQTEGTLQFKFEKSKIIEDYAVISLMSTGTDAIMIGTRNLSPANDSLRLLFYKANVLTLNVTLAANIGSGNFNVAVAYKLNDWSVFVNGVEVYTNTSVAAPSSLSDLRLLNRFGTAYNFSYPLENLSLYKTRLDNATLATLTTI